MIFRTYTTTGDTTSAKALHERFMAWATEIGFVASKAETLSRVDFTFDYFLPTVDFDSDNLVSLSEKDAVHRKNRTTQTIQYGSGDAVIRIYNKIDEINEKSQKTWFFPIWGVKENVWRIEWQIRKALLRRFSIRSFDDLLSQQGDLLRYLATEHDTLRIKGDDSNRSRWSLHPLWIDLQQQIARLDSTGLHREINLKGPLRERMSRIAISIYGNLKAIGALDHVVHDTTATSLDDVLGFLGKEIRQLHDPLDWKSDVRKRAAEIRLEPQ